MKRPKITILFLFVFLFIQQLSAQNTYKTIDATACQTLINEQSENPNFVIIDLRQPNYWNAGHVPGAINRNFYDSDFTQQLQALPKHKSYLIYCQSGGRSSRTFSQMQDLNFETVYEMRGGVSAWKNKYSTSSETFEKIMLVGYTDTIYHISESDTITVTLTNRGNKPLTFQSIILKDEHVLDHSFNLDTVVNGAEDYSFEIVHSPGYIHNDSTTVEIQTGNDTLSFAINVHKEILQNIEFEQLAECVVYPNPAKSFFYIDTGTNSDISDLSLFTMNGQVIFRKQHLLNKNKVDITGLPKGLYLLKFNAGRKTFSKKLVVSM